MNQVLMRSINTSLTSLLPVGSLLFIGSALLGAGTLREFALALFVGIGAGTYSSIFVAAPLLALWKERETEWSRRRYRSERKAARRTVSGPGRARPGPRPGRLSFTWSTGHGWTGPETQALTRQHEQHGPPAPRTR